MSASAEPALLIQRKLIFITGASRSGTTLLSFVLRNHREVLGLKELQYFGQTWDPRESQRHFSRSQSIAAAAAIFACQEQGILSARIAPAHRRSATELVDGLGDASANPAILFAAAVQQLAQAAGKQIPCEQTPRYIFYARALLEIYPAAQVVHMVRDPRAVMASQKMRWRRRRLAADGVKVPRYQSLRVWVNYHPYTVARLWSQATSAALALAQHPRVTLVKFEDLLQQPEERIAAMSLLLKQQAAELENELFARQQHLKQEFDLGIYQLPTAATLRRQLELQAKDLKEELSFMTADIAQVQDDAGFKRWLKAQVKMSRDVDYF